MRRHLPVVLTICLSISMPLSARIPAPPGFEDVRDLAENAPLVFRGQVVEVDLASKRAFVESGYVYAKEGVAIIRVDRWYRGSLSSGSVNLHFVYNDQDAANGHNCRDLEIGDYWIVFAMPGSGEVLEMYDDCEGALKVSSLLGSKTSDGFLAQMEEDFAAGLDDSAADLRIASIQRLAALGKLRSKKALHRVIAAGSGEESKWAIFAALETGDASVLPLAVPFLLNVYHEEARLVQEPNGFTYTGGGPPYFEPEGAMALAIQRLRAPEAVPSLTRLTNEASDSLVRDCARRALEEIKKMADKPGK
jgi:hypothetical protein